MNKTEDEDESPCSSSSNLFEQIPNDMAIHGAFADDCDVAAFVGEESGFDAFSGDNFDIIQFVTENNDETPIDSPINPNYYLNNCVAMQQQQQQPLHQSNNNNQMLNGQQGLRQPIILDNQCMYGGGVGVSSNGQTRLPDSPPITDISASGSSASPSSGSDSPFSPENYRNYHGMAGNGGVHPNGVLMAAMHMNQGMGGNVDPMLTDELVNHMHQRNVQLQQQVSPQSEFLSPYPPSQSTPGSHSQHSQVSPPAIGNQRGSCSSNGSVSYMMGGSNNNSGPQQTFDPRIDLYPGIGVNGNDVTMDNAGSNPQAGQKRRRTANDGASGAASLPNVKSEINGNGGRGGGNTQRIGLQQNGNRQNYPPAPPSQQSFDDYDENGLQRSIKFNSFIPEAWCPLYDCNHRELPPLNVAVVADKGFNYSLQDNCFVNQKKNHFQITASISRSPNTEIPYFVRLSNGELQPINEFMLSFCGAKHEMPTSEIQIRQSQTDRKPVPHEAVRFPIDHIMPSKQTVPRLHFSETTLNNHRKGGKPNPEQRFFLLVVKLFVATPIGPVLVQAYQSERVIVRASNPAQFQEAESDVSWQRANGNVLTYSGQVAIGTDKPIQDAQLTVLGNVVTSGQITRPSDRRVKENIADVDIKDAMSRVNQMRIVEYAYKPEVAKQWGLTEDNRHRVGVIAQELAEVLPDAVRDNGEFLTVDDTRIFYDTVAAAQELYRLTGNLECKIDQVERISAKLARFAQKRKNHLGSMASGISDFSNLFGAASLGGDNKSYISYSRTSLASNACDEANERKKRSGSSDKGHRRCRSSAYCQRGDQALCTSKVTQGTIVALVVVMALCLMAMCTLYVMDWYNRNYAHYPQHLYGYPPIVSPTPGNPLHPDPGIANYQSELDKSKIPYAWTPPLDSKAPPLTAICGQRTHCPTFCCASHLAYSFNGGKGGVVENTFLALTSNGKEHMEGLSRPAPIAGATSFLTAEPLESGVYIDVLNLNASLDQRYCVHEGACNARKGRYNLYVPISDHLPTIPLQLRFRVEDGLFVDNCGILLDFDHKSCEMESEQGMDGVADKEKEKSVGKGDRKKNEGVRTIHPVSNRVTEDIFEVSVGGFLQSAFRFRVGHTTESCSMSEDQQGRSFDEYNLVFYRTCLVDALRASQSQQQQPMPVE